MDAETVKLAPAEPPAATRQPVAAVDSLTADAAAKAVCHAPAAQRPQSTPVPAAERLTAPAAVETVSHAPAGLPAAPRRQVPLAESPTAAVDAQTAKLAPADQTPNAPPVPAALETAAADAEMEEFALAVDLPRAL